MNILTPSEAKEERRIKLENESENSIFDYEMKLDRQSIDDLVCYTVIQTIEDAIIEYGKEFIIFKSEDRLNKFFYKYINENINNLKTLLTEKGYIVEKIIDEVNKEFSYKISW